MTNGQAGSGDGNLRPFFTLNERSLVFAIVSDRERLEFVVLESFEESSIEVFDCALD
jgi:hypothetical protein